MIVTVHDYETCIKAHSVRKMEMNPRQSNFPHHLHNCRSKPKDRKYSFSHSSLHPHVKIDQRKESYLKHWCYTNKVKHHEWYFRSTLNALHLLFFYVLGLFRYSWHVSNPKVLGSGKFSISFWFPFQSKCHKQLLPPILFLFHIGINHAIRSYSNNFTTYSLFFLQIVTFSWRSDALPSVVLMGG